jgi:hypothetical protein
VYAQPIPLLVGPRPDDPFLDIIGPYASEVIKDIKEKAQRLHRGYSMPKYSRLELLGAVA